MTATLCIMPIGDWLLGGRPVSDDRIETELVQEIDSLPLSLRATETWESKQDLPEGLVEHFERLWAMDAVRHRCRLTREWKSLSDFDWRTLVLVPFASVRARVAAVYLKHLAEECWPRRLASIRLLRVEPVNCRDQKTLFSSYATTLWETWRRYESESALNLTACPRELVAASVLIASLDRVPVYLWSEERADALWLRGWGLPLKDLDEERCLRDMLNGIPADPTSSAGFQDRWGPTVENDLNTASATILRARFNWLDEKRQDQEPLSL